MSYSKRTEYLLTKARVIERDLAFRQRRNQKYFVAYFVFIAFAGMELIRRHVDQSYEPSFLGSLLFVLSFLGIAMLFLTIFRIGSDHIRTQRRLKRIQESIKFDG